MTTFLFLLVGVALWILSAVVFFIALTMCVYRDEEEA